jgi:hypothetical protein
MLADLRPAHAIVHTDSMKADWTSVSACAVQSDEEEMAASVGRAYSYVWRHLSLNGFIDKAFRTHIPSYFRDTCRLQALLPMQCLPEHEAEVLPSRPSL